MTSASIAIRLRRAGLVLAVALLAIGFAPAAEAQNSTGQPVAQQSVNTRERPPVGLTDSNDAELLRALRGAVGNVSIPDTKAGTLIQPQGRGWRQTMEGTIRSLGTWLVLGMLAILIAFFLLRGRIRIEGGASGRAVSRFNRFERFVHWFTASSFIVRALTGLNVTFGRHVLLPLLGPDLFSTMSLAFKYAHNYVAFAFMIGLVLTFVIWVIYNLPSRADLQWLAAGGGLFGRGEHPPAGKFNAGQKVIFWSVVVGGVALSVTGIYMLFPFQFGDIHSLQLMTVIHAIVAVVLIAIIIAHIYIGTLGMEGAFDAMSTGKVDENWAREHHSLWYAQLKGRPAPKYGHD
jgi:formate dehydrogenase subunit gamma